MSNQKLKSDFRKAYEKKFGELKSGMFEISRIEEIEIY